MRDNEFKELLDKVGGLLELYEYRLNTSRIINYDLRIMVEIYFSKISGMRLIEEKIYHHLNHIDSQKVDNNVD